MTFDVVEDNATWWVRLDRGRVWIGPFSERTEAAAWAHDFTGQDERTSVRTDVVGKRRRIVGGEAA
jgi:hypothetical protein